MSPDPDAALAPGPLLLSSCCRPGLWPLGVGYIGVGACPVAESDCEMLFSTWPMPDFFDGVPRGEMKRSGVCLCVGGA